MALLAQDAISHQSNSVRSMFSVQQGQGDSVPQHGCSKLYVGNLASDVAEEDLCGFFSEFGILPGFILKIVVKKGFAFVEFMNQSVADIAMEKCNGKPLMNMLVRLEPAIRKEHLNKGKKIVLMHFSNCSPNMKIDDLKNLILESGINVISVDFARSNISGSSAFNVRVASMKQAKVIVAEWNNKIVQERRIQIKIIEEFTFTDGAGGSGGNGVNYQHQTQYSQNQLPQYIPRNAMCPSSNHAADGGRYPTENKAIKLPLRILMPIEFIGAIIGRGGSMIRAIAKGTGARVEIFRLVYPHFEMPETPICIAGAPDKATQACKKIMEIMAQEMHYRGEEHYGDLALKIFVPNSVVGRIIGKGGADIKVIMGETQTHIHISNQPDFLEHNVGVIRNNKIVTIRGSIDGMVQAEAMISGKLYAAYTDGKFKDRDLEFGNMYQGHYSPFYSQQQQYTGMTYGAGSNQISGSRYPMPFPREVFPLSLNSSNDGNFMSRSQTAYMYVPDERVGVLIGRNGSSIKEIIHSSGASIQVMEGVVILNDFPFRRVVIHGGIDSLFLAEYFMYRRVVGERNLSSGDDPQLTIEMTVPSDLVGRLIGKGGVNIREIQRQNFCRIKFFTEPDLRIAREGKTYVRITGTAHAFLNAQKNICTLLVKAIMNKANNEGNGSRNESPEEEQQSHVIED